MKRKKSLIVEHDFLGGNSFVFGVFGSRRGLQAFHGTVRKSAISTQPDNQKRIKSGCLRKPGKMLKMSTEGGQLNKLILTS